MAGPVKNFLTPKWLKEFEEMKLQATSLKRQATKATSNKPQAPSDESHKLQASSDKQQAS